MTRRLSFRRRLLFAGVWLAYVAALLWGTERLFWKIGYGVPVTGSDSRSTIWAYYYPELNASGAVDADLRADDGRLDVLLLGGSVLEQIAGPLESALKRSCAAPVRVYSLCKSAHTSRDSLLKFRRLGARAFDCVIVYHGINDARMNCVRPEEFRDDYTHCGWYRGLERALDAGSFKMLDVLQERVASRLIPLGEPQAHLPDFGRDVKTGAAFRNNLEEIVRGCAARGIPIVLMTFATYAAEGYSGEAFERGELDYGAGTFKLRTEVWGRPEHVLRAIETHNDVVRGLAREHPHVRFVDQAALLPRDGRHFSDICHLTPAGCQAFVAHVLPALASLGGCGGR